MWTRPLGTLEIMTVEPPPLNTLTSAPRPATSAQIEVIFKPRPFGEVNPIPPSWESTVSCYIRIRTFYSTRILEQAPTSSAARDDECLIMDDQKLESETRELLTLPWIHHPNSIAPGLSLWAATLRVPVNAPKSLLPTFLNPLSSRQYALVIRVRIKRLCHGPLILVIPLQVIRHSPEMARRVQIESESNGDMPIISHSLGRLTLHTTGRRMSPPPYYS